MEQAISTSLRNETLTLGKNADLVGIHIDWEQQPPLIRAMVRVSRPDLPTPQQVAAVQAFINQRQQQRFRLVVQRSLVDVVGPPAPGQPERPPPPEQWPLLPPPPPPPPPVAAPPR